MKIPYSGNAPATMVARSLLADVRQATRFYNVTGHPAAGLPNQIQAM
jgi:hypothetical protein